MSALIPLSGTLELLARPLRQRRSWPNREAARILSGGAMADML
jgi:hypothetical protein